MGHLFRLVSLTLTTLARFPRNTLAIVAISRYLLAWATILLDDIVPGVLRIFGNDARVQT